jgi:hypothetical protein
MSHTNTRITPDLITSFDSIQTERNVLSTHILNCILIQRPASSVQTMDTSSSPHSQRLPVRIITHPKSCIVYSEMVSYVSEYHQPSHDSSHHHCYGSHLLPTSVQLRWSLPSSVEYQPAAIG